MACDDTIICLSLIIITHVPYGPPWFSRMSDKLLALFCKNMSSSSRPRVILLLWYKLPIFTRQYGSVVIVFWLSIISHMASFLTVKSASPSYPQEGRYSQQTGGQEDIVPHPSNRGYYVDDSSLFSQLFVAALLKSMPLKPFFGTSDSIISIVDVIVVDLMCPGSWFSSLYSEGALVTFTPGLSPSLLQVVGGVQDWSLSPSSLSEMCKRRKGDCLRLHILVYQLNHFMPVVRTFSL